MEPDEKDYDQLTVSGAWASLDNAKVALVDIAAYAITRMKATREFQLVRDDVMAIIDVIADGLYDQFKSNQEFLESKGESYPHSLYGCRQMVAAAYEQAKRDGNDEIPDGMFGKQVRAVEANRRAHFPSSIEAARKADMGEV